MNCPVIIIIIILPFASSSWLGREWVSPFDEWVSLFCSLSGVFLPEGLKDGQCTASLSVIYITEPFPSPSSLTPAILVLPLLLCSREFGCWTGEQRNLLWHQCFHRGKHSTKRLGQLNDSFFRCVAGSAFRIYSLDFFAVLYDFTHTVHRFVQSRQEDK